MTNRLTRIYTRKGDSGFTYTADGKRVDKASLLIHAQGDIDELNANIGCIVAHDIDRTIENVLVAIQHHLFNIGAELSAPQCHLISRENITWLERWIDHYNQHLPPLEEFILPGGSASIAQCHVARTVCRRAERTMVKYSNHCDIRNILLQYLNRLSDLLFVLARSIGEKQHTCYYWDRELIPPEPDSNV